MWAGDMVNDARKITEQQGGDPSRWADVKKRLPLLVKKRYYRKTRYGYARGDVAVQYVDNIRRYYDALVWLDETVRSIQKTDKSDAFGRVVTYLQSFPVILPIVVSINFLK